MVSKPECEEHGVGSAETTGQNPSSHFAKMAVTAAIADIAEYAGCDCDCDCDAGDIDDY